MSGLAADLSALAAGTQARFVLGLAGAPASGKSSLAEALVREVPDAALLPMDGFHLDDGLLEARGHRDRKGAPHTFDVAGFCVLLRRLRTGEAVYAPSFDRRLEVSRAGAIHIPPEVRIVVVEGNYLLHDSGGWEAVRPLLHACWFLDVPWPELDRRLLGRWAAHGKAPDEARAWIDGNDLPNAQIVARSRGHADRVLSAADPI
ncbi:MAG: nucleoside/nucleotide kinase family protein [Pseudomonadota bacterium]